MSYLADPNMMNGITQLGTTPPNYSLTDIIANQNDEIASLKKIILDLIKDDRPDLVLKYMSLFGDE